MSRLLSFPAGRRAKWAVLGVWLVAVLAIGAAGLPTKFEDIQKNDSASFLPGDAESTKALEATTKLQGAENVTAVVVYRRDGGLTAADRRAIAADRNELNALKLDATGKFGRAQFSKDMTSALLLADIATDGEADTIIDPVDEIRKTVSDPGGGLEVKVTGSAGFSADAIKVFENINGTLLLAASALVFVLLALIYRSPLFLWVPLLTVGMAEMLSRALGWGVAEGLGVTINGQSSSIMSVLVLGAGTDYALLLVARYREELRHTQDKHEALDAALRGAGPAIVASALTVMLALLVLSLAELNGTAGLGPIGALGVFSAMVAMLTALPAMLAIFGRRAFWPFVPYGPDGADAADAPDNESKLVRTIAAVGGALFAAVVWTALVAVPVMVLGDAAGLPSEVTPVIVGPAFLTFLVLGILGAVTDAGPRVRMLANGRAGAVGMAGLLNAGVLVGVLAGLDVAPWIVVLALVVLVAVARLAGGSLRERFTKTEHRFSDEDEPIDAEHGRWRRWGEWIAAKPRKVWIATAALLAVMALGLFSYSDALTQGNSFRDDVESVAGQKLLSKSFPSGANAPTDVIVPDASRAPAVAAALRGTDGVAVVREVGRGEPGVYLQVALEADPYSTEAFDLIPKLRAAATEAGGDDVLVGGTTAIERDVRAAAERDNKLLIPLILAVVFIVLLLLLRAVAAPILLMATVVLSFASALGVSYVAYDVLFGFAGSDPGLPLFAFVFLVALGIDYNIFLMARVREEAQTQGTREGMLRGLAVTGGVITSAGIVLAGTFAVLAVLPLVPLTQIGFAVAFGVLLDTFVVRSTLVPALVFDIGRRVWWPSRLGRP
ncbi:MAG: MMPL family transporter [Baekduia sp.]